VGVFFLSPFFVFLLEVKMASSVVIIKIEKTTLQLLEEIREETKSKTFDEVIKGTHQK